MTKTRLSSSSFFPTYPSSSKSCGGARLMKSELSHKSMSHFHLGSGDQDPNTESLNILRSTPRCPSFSPERRAAAVKITFTSLPVTPPPNGVFGSVPLYSISRRKPQGTQGHSGHEPHFQFTHQPRSIALIFYAQMGLNGEIRDKPVAQCTGQSLSQHR